MVNPRTEHKLLQQVVQAVREETGLEIEVLKEDAELDGQRVDALIRVPRCDGQLTVEVKKWAQQANLGALADQVKRLPLQGILAADYVNPAMAKKLRAMGVQFMDAAGNTYIDFPPVYINVTGNKQRVEKQPVKGAVNRAFDATGLKVVYGFLCAPDLINATYRDIAERTGVALGTVGWVLNGLKEAGFLVDKGRGKPRRLRNRQKLLDRWVEAYPEKLRPKLRMGEFVCDDAYWWKETAIDQFGAYWGGEVAAAHYTDYLKPQTLTIYLPEHAGNQLLAKARLRKATEFTADGPGIVRIYRPFWPENNHKHPAQRAGLVHPILVYADLIATGDTRNLETARMIHERYIAEYLRED